MSMNTGWLTDPKGIATPMRYASVYPIRLKRQARAAVPLLQECQVIYGVKSARSPLQ